MDTESGDSPSSDDSPADARPRTSFRCFISHPWKQNIHFFALQLGGALRGRAVEVWIDQEQVLPGDRFGERQHNGIVHETDVFIFVLAQATLDSRHCMDELACALRFSKPVIGAMIEPCSPPKTIADCDFVDFTNPMYFEFAVDRLCAGAAKHAEFQAVLRKLGDDDPDVRTEAIQILTASQSPIAFDAVERRLALECDDTVRQWFPRFFARIEFHSEAKTARAIRILEELAKDGQALTRRAARLALREIHYRLQRK